MHSLIPCVPFLSYFTTQKNPNVLCDGWTETTKARAGTGRHSCCFWMDSLAGNYSRRCFSATASNTCKTKGTRHIRRARASTSTDSDHCEANSKLRAMAPRESAASYYCKWCGWWRWWGWEYRSVVINFQNGEQLSQVAQVLLHILPFMRPIIPSLPLCLGSAAITHVSSSLSRCSSIDIRSCFPSSIKLEHRALLTIQLLLFN